MVIMCFPTVHWSKPILHLGDGVDDGCPGKPWLHHIVKDPVNGFKCLKCSTTGYVTDIRDKNCIVAPPSETAGSPMVTPTSTTRGFGASAAVVGSEMAKASVATLGVIPSTVPLNTPVPIPTTDAGELQRQIDMELALLGNLEAELAYQDVLAEEEALELAELEEQIEELEGYMTEEQMLERAIKESTEEQHERDRAEIEEKDGATTTVKRSLSAALTDAAEPPVKKAACGKSTGPKDDPDQILPLEPEAKQIYVNYWSRFVATPQNHGRSVDDAKNMPPSLPPSLQAQLVST